MYLNAQGQASDDPLVVRFHQLLGHLPMVLHPDPQDVLIVGLGGGATAGALARHQPPRFDVVELSEAVPVGATLFNHVNGNVLSYPWLSLRIDDGRNHLLLSGQRYDVITADAINPRGAGAAMLYSAEYYQLARQALKPGGIVAQWLEINPQNVDNETQRKLMARTFLSVFPYANLWGNGGLMVGSNSPLTVDPAAVRSRWSGPGGRDFTRLLAGTEFATPDLVAASFVYDDAAFRAWAGEGPIMTDDRPYVEYFLSLPGGSTLERWRGRLTGGSSGH
jgi:spermidine synthase